MSNILCIYHPTGGVPTAPAFPATDQRPDATRYTVGAYVVDVIGDAPTQAEIDAVLNPVPGAVTMKKARLALLNAGILTPVSTALANLPGVDGDKARIEWQFSTMVERNNILVKSIAVSLGLSDSQIDDLFRQAAAL